MAQDNAALWLAEEWSRQLGRTMETMTGEPAAITFTPRELSSEEIDPGGQELLWWEQPLSLNASAIIWIGALPASWQEIGSRVLRSAGVEDATPEDIRSTYFEILRQGLAGVASVIAARARKEATCTDGKSSPPPESQRQAAYSFDIAQGEQSCTILAVFPLALANLAEETSPAATRSAAPEAAEAGTQILPTSVDVLLDVELPVSVSFGRAQLMLKDVVKLTTGSIVELNRTLGEPVEVIVNNCVIARGEVVVVEGNYGIRIKQVISRNERLRTLY